MAGGISKRNASTVAPLVEKHIGVFGEGFGEGVFAKTSFPITLPFPT
jgi:hypothetical protein